MSILSVNVSLPKIVEYRGGKVETGIFKEPVADRLMVRKLNTGFYLRVLEEGDVGAGDEFELIERDPEPLTVEETVNLSYFDRDNLERAQAALRVKALPPGWREGFEERLRKAGIAAGAEAALDDCCGPSS